MEPTVPLDCVAFLLVSQGQVLVEKRKLTKRLAPGALAIPGGHLETGERVEDALTREAAEELAIVPREVSFVCTLMHHAEELRRLYYFAVRRWDGRVEAEEADAIVWLPLAAVDRLDFDVDRTAVNEYVRLEREGGLAWRTNR